jgi:DnaJ-class molecular chaperone
MLEKHIKDFLFLVEKEYVQEEDENCNHCNGSGEGMYDGSTCSMCKGSGVYR